MTGVVQGVGFRPFVHRTAAALGLSGWVRNEPGGVVIRVEGPASNLDRFVRALEADGPPLTRLDRVVRRPVEPRGLTDFRVLPSLTTVPGRLPVSPDMATCPACLEELFDPGNRRYRYPFITCTDCGPRFTVIETMPYDRERSAMRVFEQCERCLDEYGSPRDRRYHSQTNSCADCGPVLRLEVPGGEAAPGESAATTGRGSDTAAGFEAVRRAAALLMEGRILAVKGLGGFHLAVDATEAAAVDRLRQRKRRDAKPLAVMVRTLDQARELGEVGDGEARLLTGPERPIVLLRKRSGAPLAESVAPGLSTIGVMLAYTPIHHLLLDAVARPLVMTSGNLSDEPIAIDNGEAQTRLSGVADAFLLHNRDIVARYDDSLLRVVDGVPVFLRRARGYAPLPLSLPVATPMPLLAVGPHLKNTLALAEGSSVFVSQHIGDLESLETLQHFVGARSRYQTLFRLSPAAVVADLHPGYLSTRLAEDSGLRLLDPVQHHHAHVAAVQAEHGVSEPVLGVAFDGTGYGDDGKTWGAELLVSTLVGYRRLARLRYVPLPGGELAVRRPWRVALGYSSLVADGRSLIGQALDGVPKSERALAERQIREGINAPEASSMGRLFDAAAAILGVRRVARYEGQAPMELEALAGDRRGSLLAFPWTEGPDDLRVMDPIPLLTDLADRLGAGTSVADLAAAFHDTVAETTARLVGELCEQENLDTVALGGGVFQNARLLSSVRSRLLALRLRVLTPVRLGPNDGSVSFGQAAVAAARLTSESVT